MDEELLELADHLNEISQKLLTICEAGEYAVTVRSIDYYKGIGNRSGSRANVHRLDACD